MTFALTPDRERALAALLPKYPTKMAVCIPLLHLCQEQQGHVDDEVVHFVATRLDLPPAHANDAV